MAGVDVGIWYGGLLTMVTTRANGTIGLIRGVGCRLMRGETRAVSLLVVQRCNMIRLHESVLLFFLTPST